MSGDGTSQDDVLQEYPPPLQGNTGHNQEGSVSPVIIVSHIIIIA